MFESRLSHAYLIGAAVCWGLGTVLSKYALGGFDASPLPPFQLTCSVLLLGAFLLATGSSVRGIQHSMKVAALGVLNPGIAYALGLIGLARINASLSVIIWATEPVLIVLMAFVFLHERLPLWSVLCLASAMAGVVLIIGAPSHGDSLTGVVLTVSAVLACAVLDSAPSHESHGRHASCRLPAADQCACLRSGGAVHCTGTVLGHQQRDSIASGKRDCRRRSLLRRGLSSLRCRFASHVRCARGDVPDANSGLRIVGQRAAVGGGVGHGAVLWIDSCDWLHDCARETQCGPVPETKRAST
jgi:uncharacterized membrane protein